MGLNNQNDLNVRSACEELIVELLEQFDTLPVKKEAFSWKIYKTNIWLKYCADARVY